MCIEDEGLTAIYQCKISQKDHRDISLRIKPLYWAIKLSPRIYQAKRDSGPPPAFLLAEMRRDRFWSVRTFRRRLINCIKSGRHICWRWQPRGERRGLGLPTENQCGVWAVGPLRSRDSLWHSPRYTSALINHLLRPVHTFHYQL